MSQGEGTQLLERLIAWARSRSDIRGVAVIGSRARALDHPADQWSDVDILLTTTDPGRYLTTINWLGMAERTITVGAVSKEYRMIGWRVGWIVAPPEIINDIGLVNISNVVCPVGIAQAGATVALRTPDSDVAAAVAEWQRRRDVMLQELDGLPVVKPLGGWSMLMDVSSLGLTGAEASARLLERGKVAATAMTGWGSQRSERFVRFVFSNEPADRLRGLRGRVDLALK